MVASKSFASRRLRPIHAKNRSTTQRRGLLSDLGTTKREALQFVPEAAHPLARCRANVTAVMRETSDRPICDLGHFCARAIPIEDESRFERYPHPRPPPLETDNRKALRVLHRSGGLFAFGDRKEKTQRPGR